MRFGSLSRALRRCGLAMLMLVWLGDLLCGAAPPAAALMGLGRLLELRWGLTLAKIVSESTAVIVPCLTLPGWAWQADGRIMPVVAGLDLAPWLLAARRWPLRLAAHLVALSLWLGMLAALAMFVDLATRRRRLTQVCAAATATRPAHAPPWHVLLLPVLVLATLGWCLLPLESVVQAPAWGFAWLLACRWARVCASAPPVARELL